MTINQRRIRAFKRRVVESLKTVFDHPLGKPAKKAVITVVGVLLVLVGVALIILPGPAVILIPLGLGILALEYPFARKWLVKFQRWLRVSARKADAYFASKKARY